MSRIIGLREFAHLRSDPRVVILDARRSGMAAPLDNPYFTCVRLPAHRAPVTLAPLLSGRHAVVVGDDEESALDLCHALEQLEVFALALEDGELGWRDALVVERCERYPGGVDVLTLGRVAQQRRCYVAVRGAAAVAAQADGAPQAIAAAARHHGASLRAVVELETSAADTGRRLAELAGAPYYVPVPGVPGEVALDFGWLRAVTTGAGRLRLDGDGFSIAAGGVVSYRIAG